MPIGDVAGTLQPSFDIAASMADVLVPVGRQLLGLALILTVMNAAYEWWMGGVTGALARLVRTGLIITIPLFLLSGDNWVRSAQSLTSFFHKELSAPLMERAGQGGAGSGPELVKNVITRVANGIWPEQKTAHDRAKKGVFARAWAFITDPQKSVGEAIYSAMTEFFFKLLLTIVAGVLILSMLFALYAPILTLQVGVIFGPILVPWLIWEPLSDMARNWLKFMIITGFSLLVGLVFALIAVGAIDAFVFSMQEMGKDPDLPWFMELAVKVGGFLASAVTIVFLSVMLLKSSSIAASMIGGGGDGSSDVGAVIINKIMPRRTGKGGGDKPQPKPPGDK